MKKILLSVCVGAMAFGLGSAQAQRRCTIEGRVPESENGQTVYLNAYGVSQPLDSAVVRAVPARDADRGQGLRKIQG
ncbi:hypothetical protein [uncultured Rikenella sp.]|uniref:hypothetical protein n=1 Tax=uncultured Rikenella sp. TaxID=368003 RepID=UPI00260543C0|nr:hypothetical protein [uncultured Rikenella sp.]